MAKDGCYERLKFLLTNCVHYTSHLHRRMEEQRTELARAIEKQRAQNAEKDLQKKAKVCFSQLFLPCHDDVVSESCIHPLSDNSCAVYLILDRSSKIKKCRSPGNAVFSGLRIAP